MQSRWRWVTYEHSVSRKANYKSGVKEHKWGEVNCCICKMSWSLPLSKRSLDLIDLSKFLFSTQRYIHQLCVFTPTSVNAVYRCLSSPVLSLIMYLAQTQLSLAILLLLLLLLLLVLVLLLQYYCYYGYHLWMQRGIFFSHICLCACLSVCLSVCLFVCNAATFASLDLESSFLVCRYIFRISWSSSYIKVIASRSRSYKKCIYVSSLRVVRLRLKGSLVLISTSSGCCCCTTCRIANKWRYMRVNGMQVGMTSDTIIWWVRTATRTRVVTGTTWELRSEATTSSLSDLRW